mmetsp:Transcript_29005/g.48957  ORF Transcript_29005/g.48957 Transcript_29005/m.48957 type:complete len:134 (+) Transcript_29005:144-545(+)
MKERSAIGGGEVAVVDMAVEDSDSDSDSESDEDFDPDGEEDSDFSDEEESDDDDDGDNAKSTSALMKSTSGKEVQNLASDDEDEEENDEDEDESDDELDDDLEACSGDELDYLRADMSEQESAAVSGSKRKRS